MSRCTARRPYLTVAPKSVERRIRYRAGSTCVLSVVKQSTSAGLCGADRRRSRARRGCAFAAGNRALGPGGGCSAGRSACPWPRHTLLVASGMASAGQPMRSVGLAKLLRLTGNRRGLRHCAGRSRIADVWATVRRVLMQVRRVKPPRAARRTASATNQHPSQASPATEPTSNLLRAMLRKVLVTGQKPVNFCQCRFVLGRCPTTN
jgi:hypothetical protein